MSKTVILLTAAVITFMACTPTQKSAVAAQKTEQAQAMGLNGTWELDFVASPGGRMDSLYTERKPTLTFDVAAQYFSGNTSCNNINGKLSSSGNKISFKEPMAMTKMMCPGQGETVFLSTLKKINTYSVSKDGKELHFIMGDVVLMHFVKK
jgi:heat shock protein HslJ